MVVLVGGGDVGVGVGGKTWKVLVNDLICGAMVLLYGSVIGAGRQDSVNIVFLYVFSRIHPVNSLCNIIHLYSLAYCSFCFLFTPTTFLLSTFSIISLCNPSLVHSHPNPPPA